MESNRDRRRGAIAGTLILAGASAVVGTTLDGVAVIGWCAAVSLSIVALGFATVRRR